MSKNYRVDDKIKAWLIGVQYGIRQPLVDANGVSG